MGHDGPHAFPTSAGLDVGAGGSLSELPPCDPAPFQPFLELTMPRRPRYDPDPEINQYIHSWHRGQYTVLMALGLGIAWAVCRFIAGTMDMQPAVAAVPRLFAMVFGWGAIILGVLGLARCAYAYFYPPWQDR